MLELRIKQGRRHVPLFDLPAVLGRSAAAQELGDTIEGLIAFLDDLGGDADLEQTRDEDDWIDHAGDGPGCPLSDPDVCAADVELTYPEWQTLPAAQQRAGRFQGRSIDGDLIGLGLVDDAEIVGDEHDVAWGESDRNWSARQFDTMQAGSKHEDAEEDDHSGDHASEDDPSGFMSTRWGAGPGCPISDPGGYDG